MQRRGILRRGDDEIEHWEVSADVFDHLNGAKLVSHVGDLSVYGFEPFEDGSWQEIIDLR